ncbi:MAG: CBS domain-containing protein [Desulfobacteraceae bacterium]
MFRAKDVMSSTPTTVKPDAKVIDVIRLLAEYRITGLPVVSEDMRLLGMVTEKDILKLLLYDKDFKTKTAADLMTAQITYFTEDDDLMAVFKTLEQSNFRRVPILSDGKLAGIISRRDIINFLFQRAGGSVDK